MAKGRKVNGAGAPKNGDASHDHSIAAPTVRELDYVPQHGNGRLLTPWQKGQSGNPLGVIDVSAYHKARQICADASPKSAQVQVALLDDEDPRIRLLASEAVLNRGVGKPREHPDQPTRINLSGLEPEELKSLGALLKKALGL